MILLILNKECNNFDFLFSAFINHPDYRAPRFTVATMWSVFFLASTTTLAAVSPLLYAKILGNYLPIKIHYLADVKKVELNLYWRNIESQDPGHKWLRELIKDMFTNNY